MGKFFIVLMCVASFGAAAQDDAFADPGLCPGGVCPVPEDVFDVSPGVASLPSLESFEVVRTQTGDPGPERFAAFIRGEKPAESAFGKALARGGAPLLALALVAAGFMLNLTPCTLPLVPVNLALLGIGTGRSSRRTGLRKGLAFGAGMAASYGALGLVAARTGRMFGAVNGSAAFSASVAVVFLLLALSSLGVFSIDFSVLRNFMPRRHGGRSHSRHHRSGHSGRRSHRLFPAFAAGAGSAVLAGACVAPALVSALVLCAELSSRGIRSGALVPFAVGLGMALPWPIVGAGFASLPKPGAWMGRVKKLFAAVFALAAAIYAARAWSIAVPGSQVAWARRKTAEPGLVSFLQDEKSAAIVALASEKPLLVDFSADWCSACLAMEKGTLRDSEVAAAIAEVHGPALLRIDCTDTEDPAVQALLRRFRVQGLPFFAVLKAKE